MAAKMLATHLVGKSKHMGVDTVNKLVGLLVDRTRVMARRVGKLVVVLEGDNLFKMAKQSLSRSTCTLATKTVHGSIAANPATARRDLIAELELRYPGCSMHTHPKVAMVWPPHDADTQMIHLANENENACAAVESMI